jgi:hypothetical protein
MNPRITAPVLLENQLKLSGVNILFHELLMKIQQSQSQRTPIAEEIHFNEPAIGRKDDGYRQRTSSNTVATADPGPPWLRQFLKSDNNALGAFIATYLSSTENMDNSLRTFMKSLTMQIENGAIAETDKMNAVRVLKEIGPRAFPILLEYENDPLLTDIIKNTFDGKAGSGYPKEHS